MKYMRYILKLSNSLAKAISIPFQAVFWGGQGQIANFERLFNRKILYYLFTIMKSTAYVIHNTSHSYVS